jgi:hypothetical protein
LFLDQQDEFPHVWCDPRPVSTKVITVLFCITLLGRGNRCLRIPGALCPLLLMVQTVACVSYSSHCGKSVLTFIRKALVEPLLFHYVHPRDVTRLRVQMSPAPHLAWIPSIRSPTPRFRSQTRYVPGPKPCHFCIPRSSVCTHPHTAKESSRNGCSFAHSRPRIGAI